MTGDPGGPVARRRLCEERGAGAARATRLQWVCIPAGCHGVAAGGVGVEGAGGVVSPATAAVGFGAELEEQAGRLADQEVVEGDEGHVLEAGVAVSAFGSVGEPVTGREVHGLSGGVSQRRAFKVGDGTLY